VSSVTRAARREPPVPLPPRLAYLGAVVSGLLYWLASDRIGAWPFAFVAWVPLVLALHRQPTRVAILLGWVAGTAMSAATLFWVRRLFDGALAFPVPIALFAAVGVFAYQGGRVALLGWLHARASARGWPAPLVFAAAFVASETLYPALFPWNFAATVHQVPILAQVADLGGPIAVGLVLVGANLALSELALARLERRTPVGLAVVSGSSGVVLACLYGAWRMHAVDASSRAAPGASVGLVQPNSGFARTRAQYDEQLGKQLALSSDLEQAQGVDFVVWSEGAAGRPVQEETYAQQLTGIARRIGRPAIFGAIIVRSDGDDHSRTLHSAAVASDQNGAVESRYDKERLLPFLEYVPLGDSFPQLYSLFPHSDRFDPGAQPNALLLQVGGQAHRVTALLGSEDTRARFANAAVGLGEPELLVSLTHDAYWAGTDEPWEHLALSQLRAIEHHRYLVRVASAGVSAVVDPVGRVVAHADTLREAALAVPIHWLRPRTAYESLGDAPWFLVSAAAIAGAFVAARPRSRNRPKSG
jgi:apolipoprotein N-acyltransferase